MKASRDGIRTKKKKKENNFECNLSSMPKKSNEGEEVLAKKRVR